MMSKLNRFISPKTIAVIGASENLQKSAGRVLVNLMKTNFKGEIFLVNPKYENILGMRCYHSILQIEEQVDLACIIVPAKNVPIVMESCIEKGVKAVMILSSGFSENGIEGRKLEESIHRMIKGKDIAVYGPNAPGLFSYCKQWGISFSPRFEPKQFRRGNVGLISHGGSLGRAIIDSNEKGIGFSYWFSPGNEIDVNFNDCLEFLIDDPHTQTILLVIESFFEEKRFFDLIHKAYEKNKPVILLSIGTTNESISAIRFHLGKEMKTPFPWEVIQHPGLIKVDSIDEIVSLAWLFEYYQQMRGIRTVVFSWAGGASIYLADLCKRNHIHLPDLSNKLKRKFAELIKIKDYYINPLDLTTTVYDDLTLLSDCLNYISESEEFDNIIVLFPFQVDYQNEFLAKEILKIIVEKEKIIIPIFLSQGYQNELSLDLIKEKKLPYFVNEQTAIKVLSKFLEYKGFSDEWGKKDGKAHSNK
ncbi:CoA-binding protein [Bacillus aquiflavi]|nr:CoA-binding protein [Bacillus aquiflavi]